MSEICKPNKLIPNKLVFFSYLYVHIISYSLIQNCVLPKNTFLIQKLSTKLNIQPIPFEKQISSLRIILPQNKIGNFVPTYDKQFNPTKSVAPKGKNPTE